MSSVSASAPFAIFDGALRETLPRLVLRQGLPSIKKGEGHGQFVAKDRKRLLGSAAIDDDCRSAFPSANRWDYVIGYERARKAIAYFFEVHSAETEGIVVGEPRNNAELRIFRDGVTGNGARRLSDSLSLHSQTHHLR
jgi:hypothetical protein